MITVRENDDHTIDEVVALGANVHIEQMDDDFISIIIESAGQKRYIRFISNKPITAMEADL